MANSLLTLNMITREALRLWKNEYSLLAHVERIQMLQTQEVRGKST